MYRGFSFIPCISLEKVRISVPEMCLFYRTRISAIAADSASDNLTSVSAVYIGALLIVSAIVVAVTELASTVRTAANSDPAGAGLEKNTLNQATLALFGDALF